MISLIFPALLFPNTRLLHIHSACIHLMNCTRPLTYCMRCPKSASCL